ncbi:hypothetical protein SAICODRAFT_205679 [Saitoella complicata NRRL Y-17804]|uniref:uncharacterized protein n=1 Tax=Saitoella complicata (strain BCRC 22490 / CBS 7301 / JCM 7358 / NBRC 10748 / NRRL Y-17804) TaxID=698492 RepID=UPI0008674BF6|nr:uncharacterized protein SAICODRAFT_205679 [Saitoella complicata NRRL Y-17804]ODQ54763.1 hypothetical protein SAICODRAFT_205679 [Saitoella complicata NRRL Y-17804]
MGLSRLLEVYAPFGAGFSQPISSLSNPNLVCLPCGVVPAPADPVFPRGKLVSSWYFLLVGAAPRLDVFSHANPPKFPCLLDPVPELGGLRASSRRFVEEYADGPDFWLLLPESRYDQGSGPVFLLDEEEEVLSRESGRGVCFGVLLPVPYPSCADRGGSSLPPCLPDD